MKVEQKLTTWHIFSRLEWRKSGPNQGAMTSWDSMDERALTAWG